MWKSKYLALVLVLGMWQATAVGQTQATPSNYTPPTDITLVVYRLNSDGTPWVDPKTGLGAPCLPDSTVYGCTVFTGIWEYRYPYGDENPITIPIETDYLLDVVSQEMGGLLFSEEARHAQAIAARSFAYHHIHFDPYTNAPPMNNSTQFQAFIPYRWERWSNGYHFSDNPADPCAGDWELFLQQQRLICGAVNASKSYITGVNHVYNLPETPLFGTNAPAFTQFFADTPLNTETEQSIVPGTNPPRHTYPYLVGVPDPVSAHPDIIVVGHQHGMSQNGASRWGHGNMSWRGILDPWSVQWDWQQILVHYYTNVQIRDANSEPILPEARWNLLAVDWGTPSKQPPPMQPGQAYSATLQVQNTGTVDWVCDETESAYQLVYRWTYAENEQLGSNEVSYCGLGKGETAVPSHLLLQNIPNWGTGNYTLHLDVTAVADDSYLWRGYSWSVPVSHIDYSYHIYLPTMLKPAR